MQKLLACALLLALGVVAVSGSTLSDYLHDPKLARKLATTNVGNFTSYAGAILFLLLVVVVLLVLLLVVVVPLGCDFVELVFSLRATPMQCSSIFCFTILFSSLPELISPFLFIGLISVNAAFVKACLSIWRH